MSFLFYKHSMQCSQIEYFFLQNTWSLEKVTMPWYAASAVAKMCGGLSPRFTPWYNVENYKPTWPYSLPFCCFLSRSIMPIINFIFNCCGVECPYSWMIHHLWRVYAEALERVESDEDVTHVGVNLQLIIPLMEVADYCLLQTGQ